MMPVAQSCLLPFGLNNNLVIVPSQGKPGNSAQLHPSANSRIKDREGKCRIGSETFSRMSLLIGVEIFRVASMLARQMGARRFRHLCFENCSSALVPLPAWRPAWKCIVIGHV